MQILTRAIAATRRSRAFAAPLAAGPLLGQPLFVPAFVRPQFPAYGAPMARAAIDVVLEAVPPVRIPTLAELQSPRDRRRRFQFPSLLAWCALREW